MKLIDQVILLPYYPGFLLISQLPHASTPETTDKFPIVANPAKRQMICLDEFKWKLNEHLN